MTLFTSYPNITINTDGFVENGDTIDISVVVMNEGNQKRMIDLFTNKSKLLTITLNVYIIDLFIIGVEIDIPIISTQQTNGLSSSLVVSMSPSLGSGSTTINIVEVIVIVTIGGFLLFLILVIVALTPLLYLILCTKPKRKGKN